MPPSLNGRLERLVHEGRFDALDWTERGYELAHPSGVTVRVRAMLGNKTAWVEVGAAEEMVSADTLVSFLRGVARGLGVR